MTLTAPPQVPFVPIPIQLLQDRCQWGQEDGDGSFRQTQAPLHGGHVHRASTQCPWDRMDLGWIWWDLVPSGYVKIAIENGLL